MAIMDLFKSPVRRAVDTQLANYQAGQALNAFDSVAAPTENLSDYLPTMENAQRGELLRALGNYSMPTFNPSVSTLAADKGMSQVNSMINTLSRFHETPSQQYITPEVAAFASRLGNIQNNLRTSTTRYGAGLNDMNRGLTANKYMNADNRNMSNIMNALRSSTAQRKSQAGISDRSRQGAVTRMDKEMKTKLRRLKDAAEKARNEGDQNALADALLEIGRLVGSVAL